MNEKKIEKIGAQGLPTRPLLGYIIQRRDSEEKVIWKVINIILITAEGKRPVIQQEEDAKTKINALINEFSNKRT